MTASTPAPSLDALAADPGQAGQLSPEIARTMLATVAGLIPVLVAASGGTPSRPAPVEDRLLTAQEVATRLGVPVANVYELLRRGRVPSLHVGKYVRVPAQALAAWIQQGLNGGDAWAPDRVPARRVSARPARGPAPRARGGGAPAAVKGPSRP